MQEDDDPVEVLKSQLQEFRGLVTQGDRGGELLSYTHIQTYIHMCTHTHATDPAPLALSSPEVSSQLARMSHTLGVVFPGPTDTLIGQTVVKLYTDTPPPPELHVKVGTVWCGSAAFPGIPSDLSPSVMWPVPTTVLPCGNSAVCSQVVNLLLRSFCQCLLDASRLHPPNR